MLKVPDDVRERPKEYGCVIRRNVHDNAGRNWVQGDKIERSFPSAISV